MPLKNKTMKMEGRREIFKCPTKRTSAFDPDKGLSVSMHTTQHNSYNTNTFPH